MPVVSSASPGCCSTSASWKASWGRVYGEETAYQPHRTRAYLTHTRELKPVLTDGAGFKFYMARRMILDADLGDQITRFPSKIIAPAPGMGITGWLHDFVPTVGLSWD